MTIIFSSLDINFFYDKKPGSKLVQTCCVKCIRWDPFYLDAFYTCVKNQPSLVHFVQQIMKVSLSVASISMVSQHPHSAYFTCESSITLGYNTEGWLPLTHFSWYILQQYIYSSIQMLIKFGVLRGQSAIFFPWWTFSQGSTLLCLSDLNVTNFFHSTD